MPITLDYRKADGTVKTYTGNVVKDAKRTNDRLLTLNVGTVKAPVYKSFIRTQIISVVPHGWESVEA